MSPTQVAFCRTRFILTSFDKAESRLGHLDRVWLAIRIYYNVDISSFGGTMVNPLHTSGRLLTPGLNRTLVTFTLESAVWGRSPDSRRAIF